MADQPLVERCLAIVQNLDLSAWGKRPRRELAQAIVRHAEQYPTPSDEQIATLARHYAQDGPAVDAMLALDSLAGERLWTEWHAYLLHLARQKGLPPQEAEDLAQDTCIQLQRSLPNFRFAAALKTYIYTIFTRCWCQRLRRTKKGETSEADTRQEEEGEEPREAYLVDTEASPIDAGLMRELTAQQIEILKAELEHIRGSLNYRILCLYYIVGVYVEDGQVHKWTDEAIGRLLDMNAKTVATRRRDTLRRLRACPALQAAWGERTAKKARDKSPERPRDSGAGATNEVETSDKAHHDVGRATEAK